MSLVLIILVVLILFGGLGGGYYGYRGGYYGPGMYGGVGLVVILPLIVRVAAVWWRWWVAWAVVIRVLAGDCRDVLAGLPANSVHCCVTSPPYYGLRDYGTAQWDGGDVACDHVGPPMRTNNKPVDNTSTFHGGTTRANEFYRDTCGKCGAVRVDRQIGLEGTPDEYLATMVAVFREVRRVLRPDGTCWVNMGDSYVSCRRAARVERSAHSATGARIKRMVEASVTDNWRPSNC